MTLRAGRQATNEGISTLPARIITFVVQKGGRRLLEIVGVVRDSKSSTLRDEPLRFV